MLEGLKWNGKKGGGYWMVMQREVRLLREWLWKFHPYTVAHTNYALGKHGEGTDYKIFMSKAPRCDAWYEEGGEIFIVEAKVVDEAKGIAELMMYKSLFIQTPELEQYKDFKINLILLRARERKEITDLCIEMDITPVLFCPDWCAEYLAELVEKKRQR